MRDEFWARLWPAIQDNDPEAGALAMREFLDEMGAVDELREILPAEAARLAAERAARSPERSQPKRPPSRNNRKQRRR